MSGRYYDKDYGIVSRSVRPPPPVKERKAIETMLVMVRLVDLHERIQIVWSPLTLGGLMSMRPWEVRLFDRNGNTNFRRYRKAESLARFLQLYIEDPDAYTEYSKDGDVVRA